MPKHVLGIENGGALAPQDAGDARFGIAAMDVVDDDRAARAQ